MLRGFSIVLLVLAGGCGADPQPQDTGSPGDNLVLCDQLSEVTGADCTETEVCCTTDECWYETVDGVTYACEEEDCAEAATAWVDNECTFR